MKHASAILFALALAGCVAPEPPLPPAPAAAAPVQTGGIERAQLMHYGLQIEGAVPHAGQWLVLFGDRPDHWLFAFPVVHDTDNRFSLTVPVSEEEPALFWTLKPRSGWSGPVAGEAIRDLNPVARPASASRIPRKPITVPQP